MRDDGDAGCEALRNQRVEQVFLATKVEIQRCLGDAGPRRNVFCTRSSKAFLDEQGQCRVQQLSRPLPLAPLPAGVGAIKHGTLRPRGAR